MSPPPKGTLFTCEACHKSFKSSSQPNEAEAEFAQNFPHESIETAGAVCHECYKKVMTFLKTNGLL